MKWGWYDTNNLQTQDKVFDTAEEAMADMARRHGSDPGLERLAEVGYNLAIVEVTVKAVWILDKP